MGRAASRPPRLADLRWGDESHPKVTLVGKGVIFASGGLDLKSAEGMKAPKTKFQSTSYPKMFPNVFLRINYLSQSHLFGCGTRCQWSECASADFSI